MSLIQKNLEILFMLSEENQHRYKNILLDEEKRFPDLQRAIFEICLNILNLTIPIKNKSYFANKSTILEQLIDSTLSEKKKM